MKKVIFRKVEGWEPAALPRLKFFIGIFVEFYCEFYLATCRTAIFINTFFSGAPPPVTS